MATTLSAAAAQAQELVLNNLFGGIALQTAILATADFWARGAITNYPRKANHALEATLLVALLSLTLIFIALGEPLALGPVGLGSIGIGLPMPARSGCCAATSPPATGSGRPARPEEESPLALLQPDTGKSTRALMLQSAFACLVILFLGVMLVGTSEAIALQTGLGTSFIGVTLLAGATSLPELTTSITAVRLGAYTMAISNIFGSNLIMLVLVLPADALYVSGPILRGASQTVPLAITFGIFVTSVYLVGMIVRRKPRLGSLGIDSLIVLVAFLASLFAYYFAR